MNQTLIIDSNSTTDMNMHKTPGRTLYVRF